jgi:hypothetical protein
VASFQADIQPQDGLDIGLLAGLDELDGACQGTVVGQAEGSHAARFGGLNQFCRQGQAFASSRE